MGGSNQYSLSAIDTMESCAEKLEIAEYIISKTMSTVRTSNVRDFRRAVSILHDLKENKDPIIAGEALADLAYLSTFGSGGRLETDITTAFELVNKSASLGSAKGLHLLAFYYRYGISVRPNRSESTRLIKQAANKSYLPSIMALGHLHLSEFRSSNNQYDGKSCDLALNAYRTAAEVASNIIKSNDEIDYSLFENFQLSHDSLGDEFQIRMERDKETLQYYIFQAQKRSKKALHELGVIYQRGLYGLKANLETSIEYFRQASDLNYPPSMSELGRILTFGSAINVIDNPDLPYAINLLQRAVRAGDVTAMVTLSKLINEGILTSSDENIAMNYIKTAAGQGNLVAKWYLGESELSAGHLETAKALFQESSDGGNIPAKLSLVSIYERHKLQFNVSCMSIVSLYKQISEVGPWLDDNYGPREAVHEYRAYRQDSSLMLSLYASFQGYTVAHFNAAWLMLNKKKTCKILPSNHIKESLHALELFSKEYVNDSISQILLGDIYSMKQDKSTFLSNNIQNNYSMAADYYQKAANLGNVQGMEKYAWAIFKGLGRKADKSKAEEIIIRALFNAVTQKSGLDFQGGGGGHGSRVKKVLKLSLDLFRIKMSKAMDKLVKILLLSDRNTLFDKDTLKKISEDMKSSSNFKQSSTPSDHPTQDQPHAHAHAPSSSTGNNSRYFMLRDVSNSSNCVHVDGFIRPCTVSVSSVFFFHHMHTQEGGNGINIKSKSKAICALDNDALDNSLNEEEEEEDEMELSPSSSIGTAVMASSPGLASPTSKLSVKHSNRNTNPNKNTVKNNKINSNRKKSIRCLGRTSCLSQEDSEITSMPPDSCGSTGWDIYSNENNTSGTVTITVSIGMPSGDMCLAKRSEHSNSNSKGLELSSVTAMAARNSNDDDDDMTEEGKSARLFVGPCKSIQPMQLERVAVLID